MITDDFGSGEGNNKTIFSATVDNYSVVRTKIFEVTFNQLNRLIIFLKK